MNTHWIENGFSDLFRQILTGSVGCLCPHLWYLEVLIILTALFFLLFYCFPENSAGFMIYVFGVGAVYLQYSGINYNLFASLPSDIKYVAGRIPEMLPYAGIGFGMAYYKVGLRKKKSAVKIVLGSYLMLGLLYSVDLFGNLPEGFGYQGLFYIIVALLTVIIFIMLPLEKVPMALKNIIVWISRYCFGIYCIHWAVGKYLNFWLENHELTINTFKECLLIMVISFFLSIAVTTISEYMQSLQLKSG